VKAREKPAAKEEKVAEPEPEAEPEPVKIEVDELVDDVLEPVPDHNEL
jgi:hypothetical protein